MNRFGTDQTDVRVIHCCGGRDISLDFHQPFLIRFDERFEDGYQFHSLSVWHGYLVNWHTWTNWDDDDCDSYDNDSFPDKGLLLGQLNVCGESYFHIRISLFGKSKEFTREYEISLPEYRRLLKEELEAVPCGPAQVFDLHR